MGVMIMLQVKGLQLNCGIIFKFFLLPSLTANPTEKSSANAN